MSSIINYIKILELLPVELKLAIYTQDILEKLNEADALLGFQALQHDLFNLIK